MAGQSRITDVMRAASTF